MFKLLKDLTRAPEPLTPPPSTPAPSLNVPYVARQRARTVAAQAEVASRSPSAQGTSRRKSEGGISVEGEKQDLALESDTDAKRIVELLHELKEDREKSVMDYVEVG